MLLLIEVKIKKIEHDTSTYCHRFEYLTLLNTSPMVQRVIDNAPTIKGYGMLSFNPPQEFDEKELYGC